MQGLVETRVYSGWGKAWRLALAVWTLACLAAAALLVARVEAVRSGGGLAWVLGGQLLTSALLVRALWWALVAVPLGLGCLLTRPVRALRPIETAERGHRSLPPSAASPGEIAARSGVDWSDWHIAVSVILGLGAVWAGVAWLAVGLLAGRP